MADPSQLTKSGIATDATTGERFIPSSIRADGTRRREIRVRPGYKPPEDVELYRNKAALAWKNRGHGGVPGAEGVKNDNPDSSVKSESNTNPTSATSNKNAKRREAKKKSKATEGETGGDGRRNIAEIDNWRSFAAGNGGDKKKTGDGAQKPAEKTTEEASMDLEAENEKKARNLKKKLRQARDLRDKKQQGESLLPEQLDKIIKITELVRQLDSLGLDSNGDKKGLDGEGEKEKKENA